MATEIKSHPILFSTPMVQGILEGRKTQTRRTKGLLINDEPNNWFLEPHGKQNGNFIFSNKEMTLGYFTTCPYNVADILWVRESFHYVHDSETNVFLRYGYKADNDYCGAKWKPSIHMPKQACRIFLKIKSIKVERLQDISEEDAIAEGAKDRLRHSDLKVLEGLKNWKIPRPFLEHQFGFLAIWCTINGCDNWEHNPFVWVYEFERIEKPNDFI